MKNYYIYIITNKHNTVLYTGVTNNLERRMYEHKNKSVKGFSTKYNLNKLIYFELANDITVAISREKEIKKWRREKKNKLIETLNKDWEDLSLDFNSKISQSGEKLTSCDMTKTNITGLLISAGLSSRMGQFKPLIEYKGKSFLENILEKLITICDSIIVVTGYNHELILKNLENYEFLDKIETVQNKNYKLGMFSSIQVGLNEIRNEWVLFHQIDQPNLPIQFYSDLKNKISGNINWVQPVYNSRKGHPILFNQDVVKIIMQSDLSSNLREISNNANIKKMLWQCSQKEIHTDIDNRQDLNKLLES